MVGSIINVFVGSSVGMMVLSMMAIAIFSAYMLYDIKEVSSAMNDGIELMARLAWGTKPPEPGPDRLGWLQEAEMSTFCRLRRVYVRAHGEDAWNEMRSKIFKKLPGEEVPYSAEAAVATVEPKKATAIMTELDIFNRSIFSVRCDNY